MSEYRIFRNEFATRTWVKISTWWIIVLQNNGVIFIYSTIYQDKIDLKEARKLCKNFMINDRKFYTFAAM
jgi:hypothetical protein